MQSIIKFFTVFLTTAMLVAITPGVKAQTVDAALFTLGHTYLFQGNRYFRFTETTLDAGYPQRLPGGWRGLPANFQTGIDAALFYPPDGKAYFFKGNQYVRLTGTRVDRGYPMNLPGGWSGLPASFVTGIDAATFSNGHTYFFKGSQYVRFTGTTIDPGYPKALPSGWEVPSAFQSGITAALDYSPTGKNYLFRENEYIRLSPFSLDNGYPRGLPGGWDGLCSSTGRLTVNLTSITCNEETDEVGDDEPYALVTAVNLSSSIPQAEVFKYGVWNDVAEGDTRSGGGPAFWGINSHAAPVNQIDDVILLVTLIENDDESTFAKREVVKIAVVASLASSIGLTRASRVRKLINDINGAASIPAGSPGFDEVLGTTELRLAPEDLLLCSTSKTMDINGDGGRYTLIFTIENH